MENGIISAYTGSPFGNMDLLDPMMSGELSDEELDYRHLALEFLCHTHAVVLDTQVGADVVVA